jgi:UDP-GlcNAc:undecaprenyl-phosphate GlcNAc-1-phosphate transferase
MVALILKISRRMAWYDRISERKIHKGNIPRLGGLGFAVSFIAWSFVISARLTEFSPDLRFFPLLAALILVLASGICDDFRPLAPRYRLVFHTGAALCVLVSGYTFKRVLFAESGDLAVPGWDLLRYPVSFLWIVGMTNAINFIDGIDGLAGGVSLLAALSFGIVSEVSGITPLFCVCLASAVLGFMVFNAPCPRAKIFMGDGGAYFLGFTLALFPLMGDQGLPVFHAAAVLMIPIMDTIAAVWRRLRDGRRIDSPDRFHTHHKLMNLGLSARRIDAVLFALQIILGLLVYAAVKIPGRFSLIPLALAYAAGIGFFVVIHFLNRRYALAVGSAFPGGNSAGPGPESRLFP